MKRGRKPNTIEDFYKRHTPNWEDTVTCWPWNGTIGTRGYGEFVMEGRLYLAHVFSFRHYHLDGKEIPEGFEICHSCDNPPCISPFHLFTDTHQGNMLDASGKGRLSNKKIIRHERLSLTLACEIRRLYAEGRWSQSDLADIWEVDVVTICAIVNNKIWKEDKPLVKF